MEANYYISKSASNLFCEKGEDSYHIDNNYPNFYRFIKNRTIERDSVLVVKQIDSFVFNELWNNHLQLIEELRTALCANEVKGLSLNDVEEGQWYICANSLAIQPTCPYIQRFILADLHSKAYKGETIRYIEGTSIQIQVLVPLTTSFKYYIPIDLDKFWNQWNELRKKIDDVLGEYKKNYSMLPELELTPSLDNKVTNNSTITKDEEDLPF